VFDIMRKASTKKVVVDEFDKKKSKAKEMVNEQAEESEDEYAGLGGASDDESGGEPDEFVKEMIDDEGRKDVDESKLAAFFA
jgi:mediator of replication checkpoint protein 1